MKTIEKKINKIKIYLILGMIGYFIFKCFAILGIFSLFGLFFTDFGITFKLTYVVTISLLSLLFVVKELISFVKKVKYKYFYLNYLEKQIPELSSSLTTLFDPFLKNNKNISEDFINEIKNNTQKVLNNYRIWQLKPIFSTKKFITFFLTAGFSFLLLLVPFNNRFMMFFSEPLLNINLNVKQIDIYNFESKITPPKYLGKKEEHLTNFDGFLKVYNGSEIKLSGILKEDVNKCSFIFNDKEYPCKISKSKFKVDFTIISTGIYKIRFTNKFNTFETQNFSVDIIPDELPNIKIIFPEKDLTLNFNDTLEITAQASDDIVIDKVFFKYQVNSDTQSVELTYPKTQNIEIKHTLLLNEFERGDVINYYFEIYDNDEVLGPKVATSQTLKVEIISPMKIHESFLEQLDLIVTNLTIELANHLEIDINKSLGEILTEKKVYNDKILKQLILIENLLKIENPLLAEGSKLSLKKTVENLKFQIEKDEMLTVKISEALIKSLEETLIYLVDILDREKLELINELYEELKEQKNKLKELVNQYKANPSDEKKQAILKEIGKIKEKIAKIMEKLSKLSGDIENQFLNEEASKMKEMGKNIESLEELLNEGKLDEMLSQLDKLEEELNEMLENVSDKKEGLMSERDKQADMAYNQMMNDLQDMIFDENQLYKETQKLSKKILSEFEKKLDSNSDFYKKNLDLLQSAYNDLFNMNNSYLDDYDLELFAGLKEDLNMSVNSFKAKDILSTLEILKSTLNKYYMLNTTYNQVIKWGHVKLRTKATTDLKQSNASETKVKTVVDDLEKLLKEASKKLDENDKKKMDELAQLQNEIRKKLDKLKKQLEKPELQITQEDKDKFDNIDFDMSQVSEQLSGKNPKQAQTGEEKVLNSLKEFNEQKQKERNSQKQQGENSKSTQQKNVKIPNDDFKGPKELREDIMKAMKKLSPKGYDDVVKSYFENIIK